MKKNLLVTLADKNYIDQAKQLFSSVYFSAGWKGDYMLLVHEVPEEQLKWFRNKGILVKRCEALHDKEIPEHLISYYTKFYLFTPEFKQWKNIVYLDSDIIVRASLDELTKINGFAAVLNYYNIGDYIKKPPLINFEYKKSNKAQFDRLRRNYNLKEPAFNAGVMVFNTDIIKEDTLFKLKNLHELYGAINTAADQALFNLFFHKKWQRLPFIYNAWPNDLVSFPYYIKPEEIDGIVLHFLGKGACKPWDTRSYFYKEWKNNLKKAELINLEKIPDARRNWTEREVREFDLYMERKYLLYFMISRVRDHIIWPLDKKIGRIGILLRKHFPGVYFRFKGAEAKGENRFDKSKLDPKKRKPGISGFMRLRNEQDFLGKVIESHLPYLDELVIVYNRCTDRTPKIVEEYVNKYPGKIKIYKYEPYVYPQGSKKHHILPASSPHSLANYSNYALSRTTYKIAVKVDGDQIVIPGLFKKVTDSIRKNGLNRYLLFRGINLWSKDGKIYVNKEAPICGFGDIGFFPVSKKTFFIYHPDWENFTHKLKIEQAEILFFHLKGMKKDRGIGNYDLKENPRSRYHEIVKKYYANPRLISWEAFKKTEPLAKNLPSPESLGIRAIS